MNLDDALQIGADLCASSHPLMRHAPTTPRSGASAQAPEHALQPAKTFWHWHADRINSQKMLN
jgi:hypothetical protein